MNNQEARNAHVQRALDAAEMAVWDYSIILPGMTHGEINWSAEAAGMLGLPPAPLRQGISEFLVRVHADDRNRIAQALHAASTHGRLDTTCRFLRHDGKQVWIAARAGVAPAATSPGQPAPQTENGAHHVAPVSVRLIGVLWNVSPTRVAELDAMARGEMAAMTIGSIGDAVLTTDTDGRIQTMNRVAEQLTGWTLQDACNMSIDTVLRVVDELTNEPVENPVLKSLRLDQTVVFTNCSSLISRSGQRVAIEDTAAPIRGSDGVTRGVVIVFHDVSHERQLRHELSWQASHDALTGLINRREFEFQLAAALASAKSERDTHALLYLDLDQFKIVNDTCGHGAGDVLLQHLASLLQSHMRDSDVLARLGGDELGVLLLNCPARQAISLADKLREAIKDYRFVWNRNTFEVGASIGLVAINQDSKSTSELLSAADQACYVAKEQGRNRVHVYAETDLVLARRHGEIVWVSRLNDALDQHRFQLFVQPIVSLNGAGFRHAEVLIRMLGEDGLLILPGAFIPAAERYDLMLALDRWVIDTVCRHLMTQRERSPPDASATLYSINLSGVSLNDDQMHDFILGCLTRYAIEPTQICFEITETAAVANLNKAKLFMTHLQQIGVQFSLDDFGSGLSSFAYLKSLPVDFLKIDGLFVRDIASNEINRAMVSAINEVGHVMGIKTIAEYVETPEVLAVVKAIGIDFAQGYAISTLEPLASFQP